MEANKKMIKPNLQKGKSQVVSMNQFISNKDIQEEDSSQILRDEVIDNELLSENLPQQESQENEEAVVTDKLSSVPSNSKETKDSFAERQAEFKRIRRASFEKKMKLCKKRKYLDLQEEYMQVRYVLYYADDIVQESTLTKSEVRYHQILNNNQCYTLDRDYVSKLREKNGIYFQMVLKLTPPSKNSFNDLLIPLRGTLDNGQEQKQKDGGLLRQTFGKFDGQGQIEDRNNEYKSPTFKCTGEQSPINSFSESFKESVENQRPSDLQHQNTHQRMDQMLLSDSNERQFLTDDLVDAQLMTDDQQIPSLVRNDTKHSVQNIQSVAQSSDYDSIHQWDSFNINQMRKRSSFVYNNFQSPDRREIDAAKRKREIEDMDKKYNNKKQLLVIDLDQRGQIGEIVEHHNSGVNKKDFRKSHSYEVQHKRPSQGSNNASKKENLFLKLQPLESQIDEESQDAETIDQRQQESNQVASDKNQEEDDFNDQLSRVEEYSFQSVQDRSLDSGFNNGLEIKMADVENQKPGLVQNPNSNRNGRDLIQVEYIEQSEPKSGLLKQKEGLRKIGTMLKFDARQRGKSKDLLSQMQNNSNSDSKCEGLSNRSNSSGTSSEHDSVEALRLVRWKSILTLKKSVGTRMLESQHQRYLRNGQESGDQDSLVHTTSLIEEDSQNDVFNSKKRLTNKSFQLQHNRSNFLFNQPMKVPLQQVRSSVLSIRKIETEQETKTLNLETLQQSSKNQKTTFRKDKDGKDSYYRPSNKKTQDQPNTSIVNTNGLTDMQTSKDIRKLMKQRRREIAQMKKIVTKQEKEEQEEIQFCKNQEKALIKIKRLCEKLCGKKITDGYVGEEYLSKTNDDLSKSEFTYNCNDINKEAANWLQGATLQKSIGSKADRSGGSISPLEPRQPMRLQVPLVQNQKSYDGINENFINTSICKSENDFLTSQKNLEPAENARQVNRSSQLEAYDVDRDQNSSNKKKKVHRISKSKGRGRAETLSINLNGFEHDNKIDLNVKNMYSCQSLTSKNPISQKSEQSMESLLQDLRSQKSKTAQDLRKQRSKYKIAKVVSKKNLNLSAQSQERAIEQPTLLSNFADQNTYLQIKSRQDLGLTINKGSQQANLFMDAFPQQDPILNSNEKKNEQVQKERNSAKQPYQAKRAGVFRDESSIQKQDEYTHRITTGTISPASKNEEEMYSPDLPNVLTRQAAATQAAPQPSQMPQVSAFEPTDGPNNQRHSALFSESQEATLIHLNIGQQKMDVEEEMKAKAASPLVQEAFDDSDDIFERQELEDGQQLIDLDQLEDQIIQRHSSLQKQGIQQLIDGQPSLVKGQTLTYNNRLSNVSNLKIKTDSAIISPDNKTSFQFNLSGGKVIPNPPNNYQSMKFANDEIQGRTRNNQSNKYGYLTSDRQGTIASGEGSEFSFQKSPVGLNKYDKGSGNHDKFEINLAKLETFSFKKTDSPMHYQRLGENDPYINQNHSISEVNSSINVRGGSSSQSVCQINQSTSSQAKQPNGAYLKSLSLNLKSCLQDIDAEIDQRKDNPNQINQSHLQIPLTLKKEKSAISTISQRTDSQNKTPLKKQKQISKYEQEYNQKRLLLSQQNSKMKQSIIEQSQRSKSSTSLFDRKEEQPAGFHINLQHQTRNLNSEAKSGNKASRVQIIDQEAFKSEITLFRQQNSKSQIDRKILSPPKIQNLVLSKNESQAKIRRIELQISKNTRSGENSVNECFVLNYDNNEFYPQSRNSRILQTKQSSVLGKEPEEKRKSQDLYHTFDNQSNQKRNQSKNQKPFDQFQDMSKTSNMIPQVPHHQNRVSLGGMVFGLQVKQFSESPLKQGARKMSENAQQRSNGKITHHKLLNKNSRDRSIDDDLDELQSMLTRHHGRLKKTKNSNAPVPVGYQSSYGGMSNVVTSNRKNLFPVQKGATSAYTGYPMNFGRGTGSMLQKPNNYNWQNSSHNNSQDIKPAPTGNKIYQINDQAENISIFNGSESHLNEELSQFDQGIDQPPGFKGLLVDMPLFGRANSNQFLSPDKKTDPYAQHSNFNTMKIVDSKKLSGNKYAKPFGNTPQRPPMMPTYARSNRGPDRPHKQQRKYPIGYTHNSKIHELETEQSPQQAIPGLGLQKSDDNMFDFSNDEEEIPADQRVSGEFKRQDSGTASQINNNFMQTMDSKNSKRGMILQEILKKDQKMPVYYDANEGNRFSILSEIVQAQPYRSSKEKPQYQEVQVVENDNPFDDAQQQEDDNPFGQADTSDPPISMNNIQQPHSKGSSQVIKTQSGKSSQIAQPSSQGQIQTTSVIGRFSGGLQNRESMNVHTTPPKVIVEEDSSDLASAGSPFNLKLGKYNDSEPFQKRYVDRRKQLLKRDDV